MTALIMDAEGQNSLRILLLGIFLANACALSAAAKTEDFAPGPDKERPEWARLTHGTPKHNRSSESSQSAKEISPQEWEFLGFTAPELHSRYDKFSSCEPEQARFWFHGCGGIEGGGFIEVKYGGDGKVAEAWQCTSGCTYTSSGPHFTDRQKALQYAVARATKDLKFATDRDPVSIIGIRRILRTRAKANKQLGNEELAANDLKLLDRLAPLLAREDGAGNVVAGSIWVPLPRLQQEFKRNGFEIKPIAARKYQFSKTGSKGFVVTTNSRNDVKAEEAVWFLQEEIGSEAKRIISSAK